MTELHSLDVDLRSLDNSMTPVAKSGADADVKGQRFARHRATDERSTIGRMWMDQEYICGCTPTSLALPDREISKAKHSVADYRICIVRRLGASE
jgi:hypothetical protein